MPKLTLFFASLLAMASCIAQTSGTVQQLDAALTLLHQQERFNGTVLYAEQGKILYKKAFGITNIANPQPLQTNAAFNLASVSKQFVAVGILKLFEQRKLDLDAPITRYIPELPYPTVSVRNLLNHVSGIAEYFELFQQYRGSLDTLSNEGLVKLFAKFHPALEFEPGTAFKYCNTNYVLLSVIIERVSKKPFHDFFQEEIARPLGLKNSYVYQVLLPEIPANHVFGFTNENGTHRSFDLTNMDGVTGDGNIYSSVEDLFTWEQNLYTEKLLTKATLSQALQPVVLKNGKQYPYGFGWAIKKPNEQFWHTGSWQGFRNIIYRDLAKKATLILLSSGDSEEAVQWSKKWFEGKATAVVSTQLITHARVIDGTGIPARNADVRVLENKIIAVGNLQPFPGETITDAGGKVLAPGFIDSHSHIAGSLKNHPEALACLNQGITTIVSGQDGDGYEIDSIQSMLHQIPSAINIATYTGHTSLRTQVMGEANLGRPATDAEIEKMKQILQAEMKKGSLGLSTGLEYEGAYFSSRNEVLELAKATAVAGGRYISHIRSEDINMTEALDEIIEIGRQAKIPVQVSHLKLGLKDDWGRSPYILSELEKARSEGIDITADVYPYDYWHSTLKVLFPKTDYTNLATAQYAVDHTFDPSQSVLVNFAAHPEYAGKTISEIGVMRKQSPAQTLIDLIAEADSYAKAHPNATAIEDIMGKSMVEEDVINFLAWGHTNICSDGSNGGHPRGYGTFTRVLGRYVREKKIMSLETAIQKMTSQSAAQTGIKNRGIIAPGYYADLVLFNPETVTDNANIKNSKALSTGIEKVWVNGICVYEQQQSTQKFPGIFIQR